MGDDNTKAEKKRGKKLELNKETVQELNDAQLEGVAGGIELENSYGICKGGEKPVPLSDRRFAPDTTPIGCTK